MCELWFELIMHTVYLKKIGYYDYHTFVKIDCKMALFWQASFTVTQILNEDNIQVLTWEKKVLKTKDILIIIFIHFTMLIP